MRPKKQGLPRGGKAKTPHGARTNALLTQAVQAHQTGQLAQAEQLYRRVLQQEPANAEALNLLGALAVQTGKPDVAIDYIGRALRVDGANPVFHYNLALGLQAAGDRDAAIASYRQALRLKPGYTAAMANLGGLLLNKGEIEDAVACYRNVVRLAPENAMARANLGAGLLVQEQWDEAVSCFREALRLKPGYADAHNGLSAAFRAQERYDEAVSSATEALRCDPRHVRAHSNLGLAQAGNGNFEEAIVTIRAAIQLDPNSVQLHQNLGRAFFELDDFAEAETCYRQALQIEPENIEALLSLARLHSARSDYDAAIEIYDRVLEEDPDCDRARIWRASALRALGQTEAAYEVIRRLRDAGDLSSDGAIFFGELALASSRDSQIPDFQDEAVEVLEKALTAPNASSRDRSKIHFSLGKLYDGRAAFDEAFRHIQQGGALRPAPFDPEANTVSTDRRIDFYSQERLAQLPRAANRSELPVLIVGMPRSGTSLVEQILACHPDVAGAGELTDIGDIATSLGDTPGPEESGPEYLPEFDQNAIEAAAERYLEPLRELAGEAIRVTDKMPYNFLHLGLVSLLLPQARIIHCLRDPMDTCLSGYFENFRRGNHHTFDLGHIGAYYVQYQRLMAHWRRVLDIPILEVRYEDHVADPERICREMLDFLDLPWDPQCLRFHDSRRIVKTASRDQVREPIYTRSVARWRNYERHLGPLKSALAEVL